LAFDNVKKVSTIVALTIIVGISFYLSKFLRGYFTDSPSILFLLGFLPNFGLSFAIPFVYVSNRVRVGKEVRHFGFLCVITFLLMSLNEIRDQYQSGRVFDWLDIYASSIAVVTAYLLFRISLKRNLDTLHSRVVN